MEKHPGYHFINVDLPNGSSPLNRKDSRPCLKEAFQDILLVIVYNYPLYDSIPDLVALYKPAFPNLLFCGPPHNTAPPDILTVEIIHGYLGYECLGRAIKQHPGYKGYFYSNDDVILKFWNFTDFDREKIWESREFLNHVSSTRVHQSTSLGWKWWNSTYGLKNLSGPKRSIKITDHFTCTSANVIYCITCTVCKKLYIGETGRRLGDRFREHLRDVEKDDKNASKPVARHFKSAESFYATYGSLRPLATSRKHRKPQNSRTKNYFSNRHS